MRNPYTLKHFNSFKDVRFWKTDKKGKQIMLIAVC